MSIAFGETHPSLEELLIISGLDLREMGGDLMNSGTDPSRRAFYLRKFILSLQKSFYVIDKCPHAACDSSCPFRIQNAWV